MISLISKANDLVDIVEYLDRYLDLQESSSSSGWAYKACCPFHKGGNERTPSFYVNPTYNRFYCQGCSASGSVVEFISRKYKRSPVLIAEHILKCFNGNAKIDYDKISRIKERERFETAMLMLSDMCRKFIRKHADDDDAISYMDKVMIGFDNLMLKKPDGVMKSMSNILMQFELYFSKYDEE